MLARAREGLNAAGVGSALATYGAGMVVGATFASRLMRTLDFGTAVIVGPLFSVAAGLVMVATLWWLSGWLAGASFFLFGAGPVMWVVSSTTLRQTVTPAAILGRVSAPMIVGSKLRRLRTLPAALH